MWRIALAMVLVLGCKSDKGSLYGCDCSFLTDTDDTSTQKVEICESSLERAKSAAMGCAQSGAPATVQSCACAPAGTGTGSGSCRVGDCAVREHR